ncbi:hypothetical protein IC582_010840 [Cucumis melo]
MFEVAGKILDIERLPRFPNTIVPEGGSIHVEGEDISNVNLLDDTYLCYYEGCKLLNCNAQLFLSQVITCCLAI